MSIAVQDPHVSSNSRHELDITVIIVSYNTRDMTMECIRSVLEQTTIIRYELIVFDNASADGSVEAIRQNFPHVKVIASAQNVGFAMANNKVAKMHVVTGCCYSIPIRLS